MEKDHGRLEIRRVRAVAEPEVIADPDPAGAWPRLRSVGMAEAERRAGAGVSREARSSIGSLPADADHNPALPAGLGPRKRANPGKAGRSGGRLPEPLGHRAA